MKKNCKFFKSTRNQLRIVSVNLAHCPLDNICLTRCIDRILGAYTKIKVHRLFQMHPAWFANSKKRVVVSMDLSPRIIERICSFFFVPFSPFLLIESRGSFIILPLLGITRVSRVEANLCDTWHTATSDNEPPGTRLTSISHFVWCILPLLT